MSIPNDLKNYAGSAKSYADSAKSYADSALADLRQQATTTLHLDKIRAAVDPYVAPYVAQARSYTTVVTDRAERLITTVGSDPRVSRALATATTLATPVVETVQERVVSPVLAFTRRADATVTDTATTGAANTTTATPETVRKSASTTKTATTRARKAPAKKADPSV